MKTKTYLLQLRILPVLILLINSGLIAQTYNIVDFGARIHKKSTNQIQEAIDKCHNEGGGQVIIPPGTYITGTLFLKSHVHLHLMPGSVLSGSLDTADYWHAGEKHGILYAEDQTNLTISGRGTIQGNGIHFHDSTKNHLYFEFNREVIRQEENYMKEGVFFTDGPIAKKSRPGMCIKLFFCQNVKILDVVIKDTPSWAIRLGNCDDVEVRGITIYNHLLIPNSDGIHTTVSRNVRISDCDIRAGDDAIIVTGFPQKINVHGELEGQDDPHTFGNHTQKAENITVTNCMLQSISSGIRIGYGARNMRNCTFQNIVIYDSNRGIGVFTRDEGSVENILFSDIIIETSLHNGQWWGNSEPIHISAINQNKDRPLGTIQNIQFENIIARGEQGIIVYGAEPDKIKDISFKNVQLTIVDGEESASYGGNFDLRPTLRLDDRIFEHDIPGLYGQKIENLTIKEFDLRWGDDLEEYFTHGIQCHDITGLIIDGFNGQPAFNRESDYSVFLQNSRVLNIRNCISKVEKERFLKRSGKFSDTGIVMNNMTDLPKK